MAPGLDEVSRVLGRLEGSIEGLTETLREYIDDQKDADQRRDMRLDKLERHIYFAQTGWAFLVKFGAILVAVGTFGMWAYEKLGLHLIIKP